MKGWGRVVAATLAAASVLLGGTGVGRAAGALAIGSCGAYGFAYDFAREAAAARSALGKCSGGCKVVALSRACGAFAIDGKNSCGPHGYAVAARLGEAQNRALKRCYEFGGKDCVVRAWACDAKG
jgi:hypothetical protein